MFKGLSNKRIANKRLFQLLLTATVLSVLLVGAAVASAVVTSPVTSPTTAPFVGDDRVCGDQPGAYAQTAAIFPMSDDEGNNSSLLMYEINDNGVGTYLGEVANNNTINDALSEASDTSAPVTFFTADTYSVSALPSGLCQFNSTQIPTDEGKGYTCTFSCN